MKNRGGMFTGWKQVFKFTAMQNMKGAGFKISTFGVSILLFVVFIIINCVMANSQLKDSKKDSSVDIDIEDTSIETIYYFGEDEASKAVLDTTVAAVKEALDIEFKEATDDMKTKKLSNEKGSVIMYSYMDKEMVKLDFRISKEAAVDDSDVDEFASQFVLIVDNIKYSMAGLTQIQVSMVNSSEYVMSDVISIDKIDEETDFGLMMAEMIVPMIYSFVFYFAVYTYVQSIQKIVVSEKTSKLMETLLTSVKPYAVILGKVLAMATISIVQALLWIAGGVLGFFVGDKVALKIYPEYSNTISEIVGLMKTDSEVAFTATGIILAIICMILGYLVFCVLGGLSGAVVGKIEDMATAQMIFIIPTMIGFFASYLGPLMIESDGLYTVFRLIPFISPFMVPAELVIGKAAMWEGVVSALLMFVTCLVLVVITGKVYKNKVFNRG